MQQLRFGRTLYKRIAKKNIIKAECKDSAIKASGWHGVEVNLLFHRAWGQVVNHSVIKRKGHKWTVKRIKPEHLSKSISTQTVNNSKVVPLKYQQKAIKIKPMADLHNQQQTKSQILRNNRRPLNKQYGGEVVFTYETAREF